jgi:hypothetical protein
MSAHVLTSVTSRPTAGKLGPASDHPEEVARYGLGVREFFDFRDRAHGSHDPGHERLGPPVRTPDRRPSVVHPGQ